MRTPSAPLPGQVGLGKATLTGLERGTGNPRIDTLDAIAGALSIPLTDLLAAEPETGTLCVRGTAAAADGPTQELLRRVGQGHAVELWRLRLPAHSELSGIPHAPGTVEHLLVASGRLTGGPADDPHRLGPGDLLVFPGSQPHHYRTEDEPADVTVVFASPTLD